MPLKFVTDRLQRVLNAVARIVTNTRKSDRGLHHTMRRNLHWLDVTDRIQFQVAVTMFFYFFYFVLLFLPIACYILLLIMFSYCNIVCVCVCVCVCVRLSHSIKRLLTYLLMYRCLHGTAAPEYITTLCDSASNKSSRYCLRSARSTLLAVPCVNLSTYGGHAFMVTGLLFGTSFLPSESVDIGGL